MTSRNCYWCLCVAGYALPSARVVAEEVAAVDTPEEQALVQLLARDGPYVLLPDCRGKFLATLFHAFYAH